MTNRDFINNVNVNESNSFLNLLHNIDPEFENEINIVEQSRYYSNNEFKTILDRTKSGIQMLIWIVEGCHLNLIVLKYFYQVVMIH